MKKWLGRKGEIKKNNFFNKTNIACLFAYGNDSIERGNDDSENTVDP